MNGFQQRFGAASSFERRLLASLENRGWMAYPFGQAQIPESTRSTLRDYQDTYGRPTRLRWAPDIIAVRPGSGGACLIDAKTDQGETANYSVEVHALETDEIFVEKLWIPVYYVWPDQGVMTPHDVRNRFNRQRDGLGSRGSTTSFLLVNKRFAQRFNDVFGPPREQQEAV